MTEIIIILQFWLFLDKQFLLENIYDSLNNAVEYDGCDNYTCLVNPYSYISCQLMKYLNEKVTYSFYGDRNDLYYVILETNEANNFKPIEGHYGKVPIENMLGGLFLFQVLILPVEKM